MLASSLPLALFLALAPAQEADQDRSPAMQDVAMLRLRDGRVLWGSVLEHDPDAIRVQRLSNAGVVRLPWSFLDPDEERTLRLRYGYVDAVAEEVMTSADRLVLTDGTEIVGRIVRRTDEHVFVKRAESTVPVAKRLISGGSTIVQVPALDVFTKEELYQQRVFELQTELVAEGADGARANFELAQYAERLFDYAHALAHYKDAARLDPGFETSAVQAAVDRTEVKAALQEQVDHLAEIDLWRARKRYDRALELLRTFPELYPSSPLMGDWNEMRERVARYQERDLREQVVRRWHYWAQRMARTAARDLESFQSAVDFVDEGLGEAILEAVQEDLQEIAPEIQAEEVRGLWDERQAGRFRQASYGMGTWLLGEEKALADLEEEQAEVQVEEGSQAAARKRLEDRLKRYFDNQDLARKAKSDAGTEGADPEAFWGDWSTPSKAQWILARFVEDSGMFRIERIRRSPCRECGGTGVREVIFTGGAMRGEAGGRQMAACQVCHTIGIVRRVRYR